MLLAALVAPMATMAQTPPDLPPLPEGIYCLDCGYDLRGSTSARCPECGFSLELLRTGESQIPWAHRRELGRPGRRRRACGDVAGYLVVRVAADSTGRASAGHICGAAEVKQRRTEMDVYISLLALFVSCVALYKSTGLALAIRLL